GGGFVGALRSAATSAGLTLLVDAASVVDYPPEVTAALYWTCVEALSSAPRGSQATVSVLAADGGLAFEISTTGRHPEGRLERLRDRIEAVDGRISIDDREDGGSR